MDKSKKAKKGRPENIIDSESHEDVEEKKQEKNARGKNKESKTEEMSKEVSKPNSKKEKKGASKKKKESDSEEDDEVVAPTKMSAFQLLAVEGDSNDDEKDDEDDSDASVEVKKVEVTNQKKGKKAKQEKKKQKPAEEDDIDKLVAEITSKETTASQKKKGDKKKDMPEKEEKMSDAAHEQKSAPAVNITSNMTQEELYKMMDEMDLSDDDDQKGKKKKTKKKQEGVKQQDSKEAVSGEDDEGDEDEASTVKSAAQKKKEKKERQKADKLKKAETKGKEKKEDKDAGDKLQAVDKKTEKDAVAAKETEKDVVTTKETGKDDAKTKETGKDAVIAKEAMVESVHDEGKEAAEAEEESKVSKKDKKKKKDEKEKEKTKKPSKMVQEILERQKRLKEEEERLKREEEEKIRKEEEAIRLKEEEEKRIKEKKERLKQKKKDKIERKKKEGTYLTEKQKEDQRRVMEMIGIYHKEVPDEANRGAGAKHPRYDKKPKKNRQVSTEAKSDSAETTPVSDTKVEPLLTEAENLEAATIQAAETEKVEEVEDDVKDAWDVSSDEEEEEEDDEEDTGKKETAVPVAKETPAKVEVKEEEKEAPASEEEKESSEEEEDESEEESSSEEDDGRTAQEKAREKALARIQKRKDEAEVKKSLDKLRAPVVCVLGHVDTGKTKILDKLRRTNVQDGEAGGITQQIGATNVPQETIKEQTKMCKEFQKQELKLPGLLIIDTPGHESFSNLRNRGSSLCDIAILVVDIMHGLEPQTIESINLLKQKKTPFVVALNKIDRLYGWQTNPHSDIINTLNRQKQNTRIEFNDHTKEVIVQFAEQGLNATLFHENKNPREYISLVPTSAHTGDGMGNLIALICELTQTMLAKRLMYSEDLKATVMEVKTIHGLGTTIDVILVNGKIHEGDHIIVAGQEGPIVTQIRALLMPQPLRELRVKSQYEHHKEIFAAQGCKIVAKDLEKALAGLPLFVAVESDETEIYKEELSQMLRDVLGDVKVAEKGVFVQASTLGSLEALLQFLKTSEIPFAGINIGPVHKKDIMKASVMLEHDPQFAVILAFDVKVEHEAQVMADSLGVRIFTADIIYHLFDAFTKYREDFKQRKREEFKHIAVFPCKLRIMPQYIFNSRDPIVCGVIVEAGFIKEGTPLCVPSKEFLEIGRVSSIEVNHKTVDKANKGQEVCIKIDPIPGEAPKMFSRHFDENDLLVSKISRQSIDAVKNYFREEMTKPDWQLIMELKKTFEIL